MPPRFLYDQIDNPLGTPDAYIMPYIVFGPQHQAKVANFDLPTSTGNFSISTVGFQPECLIIFGAVTFFGSAFEEGFLHFGVATGASDQWAMSIFVDDNVAPASMIRSRRWADNRIISQVSHSSPDFSASLVSFNSNGFTLNFDDVPGVAGIDATYLALRGGGPYACGIETAPGSTGTQTIPVGFVPEAMLFGTVGVASTGIHDDSSFSIGAADSSRQNCAWAGALKLALNTGGIQSPTSVIVLADVDTGSATLTAKAERVTLDAGGGDVEIDWTTALAHDFGWLAIGSNAAVDRFEFTPGANDVAVITPITPHAFFGFNQSYVESEDDQVVVEGAVMGLSAVDNSITSEASASYKDASSPTLSVPQAARDHKTGMWGCYLRDVGGLVGTGAGSLVHRCNIVQLLRGFVPQIYRRVIEGRQR